MMSNNVAIAKNAAKASFRIRDTLALRAWLTVQVSERASSASIIGVTRSIV
jgi:hypothetical protein